jgi:amino acid transporter/nucleotide-binding universal stress UspA family protein
LRWYLAGPMFFGDLGTSRLYVLGLALFYAGTAAPYYVAAICALVLLVGWAYTVVCRVNPDGGGVYSSGRMLHPTLGVVGALLLFANYVVTAAISTYEAVIYIGGPFGMARELAPWLSVLAIALLGLLNYVGSRRAGAFALLVAFSAIVITAVLASLTIRHVPAGWRTITPPTGGPWNMWLTFVAVVLALSGVESIANMTGIMVKPVKRTSRLSIWPVVSEVILLNLILVLVVVSIPNLGELGIDGIIADKTPEAITEYEHSLKDQVLYVVAKQYVGNTFAAVASIIFGLLLLSATNTAIVAMISIQYAMSRDRELPEPFSRLNNYGVPGYCLIAACGLPVVVCVIAQDVQTLATLYAIGVVGAIAINLGSCAYNRALDIIKPARLGLWVLAAVMGLIWLTIAGTNWPALLFLTVIVAGGMMLRTLTRWVPVPAAEVPAAEAPVALAEERLPPLAFDPSKGRILVATRGNLNLLRFAFEEARQRSANLFVLFVRDIAVLFGGQEHPLRPEEDAEASVLFGAANELARQHGVPLQEIYCVSHDPADVILDFSATYAADLVILGVSRRVGVMRALRGDVISGVADNLPAESTLLIHA